MDMDKEARRPKDDEEDWDMAHDAPLGDADPVQAAHERLHGTRPTERPEPDWDW